MSQNRNSIAFAVAVTALVASTFPGTRDAEAAADPKTVAKCQAIVKTQGAKLVAKKLGALTKCATGVAKCMQTIDDEAKRAACVTKARIGCVKALAAITAARAADVAAVTAACGALDPVQVTGAGGLGFGAVDCAEFAGPVTNVDGLAACVASQHDCLASRLVQLAMPRLPELLAFTPPSAPVVPVTDAGRLACLVDHGGAGADVGDAALGKSLSKCQSAIVKATTKLVSGPLKTLEKCVDALFTCAQTKAGDEFAKCRDKARTACAKAFDKQRTQSDALAASFGAACGDDAVFAALTSAAGGGLGALLAATGDAARCVSLATVGDYQACVRSETERLVHDLLRFEAPTAETLLGAVGCDLGSCGAAPTPSATPAGPTATNGGSATPVPTVTPGGACPTTYELTFDGVAADEDFGWTGAYHDEPLPSNVRLTFGVSNCTHPVTPCGECALAGPIVNAGGVTFGNRRCRGTATGADGSWITCTSAGDCPGTGNACVYFAGPPQGLVGFPLCLVTEVATPANGVVDFDTGDVDVALDVRVATFAGVSTYHPCPSCTGGTCSSGARVGQPCTVQGHSTFTGDDVSLDCPPEVPQNPFGIRRYRMPLSTGASSVTLGASSLDCGDPPTKKCFCQTCNDAAATPCFGDADCVAVGATTCGGRRCKGGPNNGAPCTSNTQCPSATCAVPGVDTEPNACNDHVCTANPADHDSVNEGVCLAGPSYKACTIERLRGCNTNADCTFVGDSCITHAYNCFTDNGEIGSTISAAGAASTTNPTLAGLFCMPPTNSLAADLLLGLPGLGRAKLPATAIAE